MLLNENKHKFQIYVGREDPLNGKFLFSPREVFSPSKILASRAFYFQHRNFQKFSSVSCSCFEIIFFYEKLHFKLETISHRKLFHSQVLCGNVFSPLPSTSSLSIIYASGKKVLCLIISSETFCFVFYSAEQHEKVYLFFGLGWKEMFGGRLRSLGSCWRRRKLLQEDAEDYRIN